MEPGGESTQQVFFLHFIERTILTTHRYESIKTVTNSPPKQKGQLGGMPYSIEPRRLLRARLTRESK
jgi:hypothetical protein